MKRSRKVLAFLLVTIMLFSLVLVSCSEPAPDPVETEYTEPIPEGYRQLTLYFTYNGTYFENYLGIDMEAFAEATS